MRDFLNIAKAFRETAIVDDDFPRMAHQFDSTLRYYLETLPKIVCLCGSTRFWREFQEASLRETIAGNIILSIGAARCDDRDDKSFGGYVPVDEFDKVKEALDELHKRKIDLADEVLVLNVGGYIGNSTRGEIDYALASGKPVRYLET